MRHEAYFCFVSNEDKSGTRTNDIEALKWNEVQDMFELSSPLLRASIYNTIHEDFRKDRRSSIFSLSLPFLVYFVLLFSLVILDLFFFSFRTSSSLLLCFQFLDCKGDISEFVCNYGTVLLLSPKFLFNTRYLTSLNTTGYKELTSCNLTTWYAVNMNIYIYLKWLIY